MKFYYFLNEERTDIIKKDKFLELLHKNCSQFLKNGEKIYRGINRYFDYGYLNTLNYKRRSKNTENYYTIMLDEILPSWNGWPKRSKSIICSTSLNTSRYFGNIYEVYPYDNCKIGVCSNCDMWYSFDIFNQSLDSFNVILINISDIFDYDLKETKRSLMGLFKHLDEYNITYIIDKLKERNFNNAIKLLHGKGNKSMIEHLSNLFDPVKNGFKLYESSRYKHHENREVFIEGKCLLIYEQVKKEEEISKKAEDAVKTILGK